MQNDHCMTSMYRKSDKRAMHSNRSRGTLMAYSDHSAQRCFKSNEPIISVCDSADMKLRRSLSLNEELLLQSGTGLVRAVQCTKYRSEYVYSSTCGIQFCMCMSPFTNLISFIDIFSPN